MSSIEKMELVNIVGLLKYLDDTLIQCIRSGVFHIEQSSQIAEESGAAGFVNLHEQNPYKDLLKQIISIDLDGYKLHEADTAPAAGMTDQEMKDYIADMHMRCSAFSTQIAQYTDYIAERTQALKQLEHLQGMNVDLQKLFQCSHIAIRFGKLPSDSYLKLSYYQEKTFLFLPYDDDGEYRWGFYFAPKDSITETDEIMRSLFFERIWMPDFVTGTPEQATNDLKADLESAQTELYEAHKAQQELLARESEKINAVFCKVKFLYEKFKLRSFASVYRDKFYLVGFIPAKEKDRFKKLFADIPDVSIICKPPETASHIETPVKLKNNFFTRPFSMFVEMYGLPRYNGFNPTGLVAITYTILFGIMFGDLGHGLVVSLFGFLFYKKTKNQLGAILARIGLSSAFFGLIFGSVFGFEHALDPLYHAIGLAHKPIEVMENINLILFGAIGIGVVLILISIVINTILNLKKKDYTEALFGNNGLFGLIFFGAILFMLVGTMFLKINLVKPWYILLFLVLPIVIMFFREPLGCLMEHKKYHVESVGDFIASNFFEVFEFLLSYATNTLSFVRIGGFVFSHAGMMSVVLMLSKTASAGASPIIIVLGNLFVIGMEGVLAAIQVLRLEFYEIFSRFYTESDGKAFTPVSISYDPVVE